jgi:hypothetical protein
MMFEGPDPAWPGLARPSALLLRDALTPLGLRDILPPPARIAAALDARGHRLPLWSDVPGVVTPGVVTPGVATPGLATPAPPLSRAETSSAQPQPVQ